MIIGDRRIVGTEVLQARLCFYSLNNEIFREFEMSKTLKILAAAGLFAVSVGMVSAAPANVGQVTGLENGVTDGITRVHRCHADCRRYRRGYHRHNRNCERRSCQQWRGSGRRPDGCVRFGQVWICP